MAAASRARRSRASRRCSGFASAPPVTFASSALDSLARHEPAGAARPRLAPIQAAVDENAREPDLERPDLTIIGNVREHLDERVLDGLVGIGAVPQVLIGNAQSATLMQRDQRAESLPGLVELSALDERPNIDGELRVLGERSGNRPTARHSAEAAGVGFDDRHAGNGPQIATHRVLRRERSRCLQCTVPATAIESFDSADLAG